MYRLPNKNSLLKYVYFIYQAKPKKTDIDIKSQATSIYNTAKHQGGPA